MLLLPCKNTLSRLVIIITHMHIFTEYHRLFSVMFQLYRFGPHRMGLAPLQLTARRYYDQANLLVRWFVCLLVNWFFILTVIFRKELV